MNRKIHVLVVENEPLITHSYKKALKSLSNSTGTLNFKIKNVRNYDKAYFQIEKAVTGIPFDLVLLNINIPLTKSRKPISGEDLCMGIKRFFVKVKIIVFTSHHDNYRFSNILKTIDPDGFVLKNEIDSKELIKVISKVILDSPYYSSTILRLIRGLATNEFFLDRIDRELLYHLSRGVKSKDLPDYLYLSKSGVALRKRNLKEVFDIENNDDTALLKCAAENGYI
jgi:DNA-binding NarL/FixJ family response regulator